jgi:hypothetical protein
MTAIAAIKLTIAELKPAPIEIENQEDKPPNTSEAYWAIPLVRC